MTPVTALTYTAYNNERAYQFISNVTAEIIHGFNLADQDIVPFLSSQTDGQAIVNFLDANRLTPEAVLRAYKACHRTGAEHLLSFPQVASWYQNALKHQKPEAPGVFPPATAAQLSAARKLYANNDIVIDNNACISPGSNGCWVQSWVWIGA